MLEIAAEEHWVSKGAVSLFVWHKHAPAAVTPDRLPVVLVHGSSLSALPTFDVTVPGHPDYSFMDWLATRGWDVWALDHEGYGRSTITEGNADIATGAADLAALAQHIAATTGHDRMHVYGLSSGALRAAAFAQATPERIGRLVLDAFVWTGKDSPTLTKRREGVEFFRSHNRRPIDRAFITSIFTRDLPGTTDPAVVDAVVDAQCAYADSVPTGTYLDMTTKLPLVDPLRIACPTMIVRGEHDGIATMADLIEFFRLLPAGDKQLCVLSGLAHSTPLGIHRHRMWRTVESFLSLG